jgi:hypothetical protein
VNTQLRPDIVTTVDHRDAALVAELIDAGAEYAAALEEARRTKARFEAAQAALRDSRELEAA